MIDQKLLCPILFVAFLHISVFSSAQEKQFPSTDESSRIDELNQGLDAHHSTLRERESQRDSVSVKSIASNIPKMDAAAKSKVEEETLSFNFLYFIIQKFKVSDMIND